MIGVEPLIDWEDIQFPKKKILFETNFDCYVLTLIMSMSFDKGFISQLKFSLVISPRFKGNPGAFLEAWCRSSGMDIPSRTASRVSFFIFFIDAIVIELKFGRCQHSKPVLCFLPGFHPSKGMFGWRIRNGSTNEFRSNLFWLHYQKRSTFIFCSSLFSLYQGTASGPKEHCFWDGMNLGRWVHVTFPWSWG